MTDPRSTWMATAHSNVLAAVPCLLITLVAFASMARGAQAAPPETQLIVPADSVVLHLDGARVSWRTELQLARGRHRLRINEPGALISAGATLAPQVRVECGAGLTVSAISFGAPVIPPDLRRALETAESDVATLELERARLEDDLEVARLFERRVADGGAARENPLELSQMLAELATRRESIRTELAEIETRLDATRRRLNAVLEQVQGRAPDLLVDVLADGSRSTLALHAPVFGALYWEAIASVLIDSRRDQARFELEASITNDLPIEWRDVRLALVPERLDAALEPDPVDPVSIDRAADAGEFAASRAGGSLGDPGEDPATWETQFSSIFVRYELDGSFTIPSRATLQDATNPRVRIATRVMRSSLERDARPINSEDVWLATRLAGTPDLAIPRLDATVYVDGDLAGELVFGPLEPGLSFRLPLGTAPGLVVSRDRVSRDRETTGLFGGGVQITSVYRIELRNGRETPALVRVTDRMPISRDRAIEVRLLAPSQPLATDAESVRLREEKGILAWNVTVPPAANGKEGVLRIDWTVRVAHGNDVRTTSIPD